MTGGHRLRRWMSHAVVVALAIVWVVTLRPALLGGPAAYVLVSGHSMEPNLRSGDLVVTRRQQTYRPGDVIAYRVPDGEPAAGARVIHRISGGSEATGYRTRGDNRDEADTWRPRPADIEGRQWIRLPWAGAVVMTLAQPLWLGAMAGLLAFALAAPGARGGGPAAPAAGIMRRCRRSPS